MKPKDIDVPIPKWLIKGKKIELPDGNIAIFAGKKKNDYCIIVKDEKEKIHLNFVIKPDEYELHLRNEITKEKKLFFERYSSVIQDLVEFYRKKYPELVRWFPAKNWKDSNFVIDIDSKKMPSVRWNEGVFDIEPEDIKSNAMLREDILKMKFKVGVMFNALGKNKGMLLALKKKKTLISVDKTLVERILTTAIGFEQIKEGILEECKIQKEKLDAQQN